MADKYERVPEVEALLDKLKNGNIYRDMRNKFDEYSEEYVPETHDCLVWKYAAQKYNITADAAAKIYKDTDTEIINLHRSWINRD